MTNAPVNRRTTWIGAGLIILILALTIIAINPLHDFPVEDDWDYSRMVKIFHDTGVLQRSDYAQATLIFPALYGGLVSNLFGFSFTNLRLSTLVLALVTLLAFYVLLGELKLDVPRRIIGTLTLLVAPIFIYLAFSFMTDVPALCWLTLAILFYVRALKRHTLLDTLIGSCCAAFMFLTRQTGAFVPVAFGLIVLLRLPRSSWIKFLGAGVVPAAAVIALYLLLNRNSTDNWATQNITLGLTVSQLAQPEWWGIFLRRAVQSLMTISLYLTPLFAALLIGMNLNAGGLQEKSKSNGLRVVVLLAAGVMLALTIARLGSRGEWFPYLTDILTRAGMRPYLAYISWDAQALRPDLFPLWFYLFLTLIAGLLALALVYLVIRRGSLLREPVELQFIWIVMLLIALASFVFATFYERYLLPLFLGAIILVLDRSRDMHFSWRAGAVGLVLVAVSSWLLMQDYWSWNEARWRIGRELLAQNIPAHKIDGGYEWDGWYLYDSTVAYIKETGKPFTYDPWQYVLDPEYAFTFSPLKNYRVERTVEFSTPFANNRFYLWRRE